MYLEKHARYPFTADDREIQDILWTGTSPEIPKRFRRDIAHALAKEPFYLNKDAFDTLVSKLWVISNPLEEWLGPGEGSLVRQIDRHVHRNPDDWSHEILFDKLGAFKSSDARFCKFLEGLASSDVRPDESKQRQFVEIVNGILAKCRVEMRESGLDGGYPIFRVVSKDMTPAKPPKNLIFASSVKPDLRFQDAINNDIEIVTNEDKVLVYDRPIGLEGLRWRDLQAWWGEQKATSDPDDAKRSLYHRLQESLPTSSPPQKLVFDTYYKTFPKADVPELPALLPEVWLHWDPKTVSERGPQALTRSRMDFLLLLPRGMRIVLEVDGKHHYSKQDGYANPAGYADMVAADRDLKLRGYEVFRFGVAELSRANSVRMLKDFFKTLFKRYEVIT